MMARLIQWLRFERPCQRASAIIDANLAATERLVEKLTEADATLTAYAARNMEHQVTPLRRASDRG